MLTRVRRYRLFGRHDPVVALFVLCALLVALVTWVGVFRYIAHRESTAIALATTTNANLVHSLKEHVLRLTGDIDAHAQALAADVRARGIARVNLADYWRQINPAHQYIQGFSILDRGGMVVASSMAGTQEFWGDRDLFRALIDGPQNTLFVGRPVQFKDEGAPAMLVFSRKLHSAVGQLLGVLVVIVDPQYFNTFFDSLNLPPESNVLLFRTDGIVLANNKGQAITIGSDISDSPSHGNKISSYNGAFVSKGRMDGIPRVVTFENLAEYPLIVQVGTPLEHVLEPVAHDFFLYYGIAAGITFVLLGSVFGVVWISRRNHLATVAIRGAEAEHRALAERTVAQLQLHELNNWRGERAVLDFGLERAQHLTASKIGFIQFVDEDQEAVDMAAMSGNAQRLCHLGADRKNVVSKAGMWAHAITLKQPVLVNNYPVLATKKGVPPGHIELQRFVSVPVVDDGFVRLVLAVANKETEYTREDADVAQLLANDIWRIVRRMRAEAELSAINAQLEQRVADRTAELERTNQELDSFSYSVSHDLRAPLRAIHGFAKILRDSVTDKIHPTDLAMLDRVITGSTRMNEMLEDLLRFSHISREELRKRKTDINAVVKNVLSILQQSYPNTEIAVGDLPITVVDTGLVSQVFQNLIGNALKFSSKAAAPRVEIGIENNASETVFYIKDNGAGFEPRYANKMFGMFQRFHKDSDFPGTGVGLAIVKAIVERHGGTIWANSAPNAGATFRFTLGPQSSVEDAQPVA